MNLVGKIFTVLICLFCVVLMALSMVVYATHTKWNEKAIDLDKKVQQARAEKTEAQRQNEVLQADLNTQKKLLTDSVAALSTEKTKLEADVKRQRDELTALDAKQRDAVAKMEAAQQQYAKSKARQEQIEKQLREAQQVRDNSFNETAKRTDELHQLAAELALLKKTNTTLAADIAKYRKAAERVGVNLNAAEMTPPVYSHITKTSEGVTGLMEIDNGSDQGLVAGHKLEVYRGADYLGRVEVVSTTPHTAAVRPVQGFQVGAMKKGDNVTNKLK
jgi:hypothetical protein